MMDVYMYQAALICDKCAMEAMMDIAMVSLPLTSIDDSDEFPQGPIPDGGGEADYPQHCDNCDIFLENPLTTDGFDYVCEAIHYNVGDPEVLSEWQDYYWGIMDFKYMH
jgi:hypothetical protein